MTIMPLPQPTFFKLGIGWESGTIVIQRHLDFLGISNFILQGFCGATVLDDVFSLHANNTQGQHLSTPS